MNLLARITSPTSEARSSFPALAWSDYQSLISAQFLYQGNSYLSGYDNPADGLHAIVDLVHDQDNVVSGAAVARAFVMSQVRFAWRNTIRTNTGYRQLFGNADLALLERPDPGSMTRPTMLATMELHASYAGAAYVVRHANHLEVLDPSLVDVVMLGPDDVMAVHRGSARKAGILYHRHGRGHGVAPEPYTSSEVIQWCPEPDPSHWWRGSSWVTSLFSEVMIDKASTRYLRRFFDHAATPNLIIKPHESLTPENVDLYREVFAKEYAGVNNAFRTMWLGGGSDVTVVGSKLADLDLKSLQGGSETRVAVRSRVPAAILGIREGLGGSALNAGNYAATRRLWADTWYSPSVQGLCAAVESAFPPPVGAEMWHDDADVLLLQEDAKDAAEIMQTHANALQALDSAGYQADAAVAAIRDNNLSALLGAHDGNQSVQRQPMDPGGSQ